MRPPGGGATPRGPFALADAGVWEPRKSRPLAPTPPVNVVNVVNVARGKATWAFTRDPAGWPTSGC